MMDAAKFWQLIDTSRDDADCNPELHMRILQEMLAEVPEQEIVEFDRLFSELHGRAYTWDLWGAAYLIGGGCSDDGFFDFRGWLISKGRKFYEAALANPEALAVLMTDADDNGQIEGFQYIAADAWAERTGRDRSEFPHAAVPHPPEPSGEPWTDDELPERFPKLSGQTKAFEPSQEFADLFFKAIDHGFESIKDGAGPLIPFSMTVSADGQLSLKRYVMDELQEAVARAQASITPEMPGVTMYAIAWDGYVTIDGQKTDAILVEAGQASDPRGVLFCQRYRTVRKGLFFKKVCERVGNPGLIEYPPSRLVSPTPVC